MSVATLGQPARPPLPLRAEIGRQIRRRRTIGIFTVLTVLPLVLLLAFWLGDGDGDSGERGFVDLAQESGANLVIFTLFASTSFLLVVIVALFAGDTVPSEASWASLRYLLAAPIRRERLWMGPLCRPDRKPDRLAGIRRSAFDHCRLPVTRDVGRGCICLHARRAHRCAAGSGGWCGAVDDLVRNPGFDHRVGQHPGRSSRSLRVRLARCPGTDRRLFRHD